MSLKDHLTQIYDIDNPSVVIYAPLRPFVDKITLDQNRELIKLLKAMKNEHHDRMKLLNKMRRELLP